MTLTSCLRIGTQERCRALRRRSEGGQSGRAAGQWFPLRAASPIRAQLRRAVAPCLSRPAHASGQWAPLRYPPVEALRRASTTQLFPSRRPAKRPAQATTCLPGTCTYIRARVATVHGCIQTVLCQQDSSRCARRAETNQALALCRVVPCCSSAPSCPLPGFSGSLGTPWPADLAWVWPWIGAGLQG